MLKLDILNQLLYFKQAVENLYNDLDKWQLLICNYPLSLENNQFLIDISKLSIVKYQCTIVNCKLRIYK